MFWIEYETSLQVMCFHIYLVPSCQGYCGDVVNIFVTWGLAGRGGPLGVGLEGYLLQVLALVSAS